MPTILSDPPNKTALSAKPISPGRRPLHLFKTPPGRALRIALGFLAAVLLSYIGIQQLLPPLSASLAENLPGNWIRASSERALSAFDAQQLQASRLPTEQQESLQRSFAGLTPPAAGATPYRLMFRASNSSTPLLFSLPSGDIVITDRFFTSIPEPDLQIALLCIELGHIQYQHALREALSHKLVWLASAALVGSSESSIRALSEGVRGAHYSQQQLLEADQYARAMLEASAYPPAKLENALQRLASSTSPAQLGRAEALADHRQARLARLRATP